jgi:hypothetical protein
VVMIKSSLVWNNINDERGSTRLALVTRSDPSTNLSIEILIPGTAALADGAIETGDDS